MPYDYSRPYVYSFCQIIQALCLFPALEVLQPRMEVPLPRPTSIPDSTICSSKTIFRHFPYIFYYNIVWIMTKKIIDIFLIVQLNFFFCSLFLTRTWTIWVRFAGLSPWRPSKTFSLPAHTLPRVEIRQIYHLQAT